MTGKTQTARVNQTTLAYRRSGTGNQTLLLIHGALISHTDLAPQEGLFGERYQLLMPDLRGHGTSGTNGRPYSIKQYASDMAGLLDALNINQVAVVGHSLGGMVAQEFALAYPERLWALKLAETSYGIRSTWYEALLT